MAFRCLSENIMLQISSRVFREWTSWSLNRKPLYCSPFPLLSTSTGAMGGLYVSMCFRLLQCDLFIFIESCLPHSNYKYMKLLFVWTSNYWYYSMWQTLGVDTTVTRLGRKVVHVQHITTRPGYKCVQNRVRCPVQNIQSDSFRPCRKNPIT